MSPIFRVAAGELAPHHLLARIGLLPDLISREATLGRKASGSNREDHQERAAVLTEEFSAMVADIAVHGIQKPLEVVAAPAGGWLIADGRNRWAAYQAACESDPEAAERLEAVGIPCIEIAPEDVPAAILRAQMRRHLSKQARALVAVMIHPETAEEPKEGRPKKLAGERLVSQSELAAKVGVGVTTLKEACQFWRLAALKKPAVRDEMFNQVFSGIGFAEVALGEKGRAATAGVTRNPTKVWTLMTRNAASLKGLWKDYSTLDDEEKKIDIVEQLVSALTVAPDEVKTAILTALEGGAT